MDGWTEAYGDCWLCMIWGWVNGWVYEWIDVCIGGWWLDGWMSGYCELVLRYLI